MNPRIRHAIHELGKAAWFTKLALQRGFYHQVETAKEDQWEIELEYRYGTPHFKDMPFGLAGGPSAVQRMMTNVFLDELLSLFRCFAFFELRGRTPPSIEDSVGTTRRTQTV